MSPLALSLHFLQAQPDNRLVALAREGHGPAFEALVHRYRKELLAYCRRLQPRSGSAEDALQQAFLQAWKALSAGAEVRDVRPWLYRIAHNVTLNQLRVASPVLHDVSEAGGGQEVHQLVEQRLQARAALAGMAALPARQRDAFISTTLDGASHEQVAAALGLSSGAVRGLIYRARATLRSAAAALTPSPALHWALRRVETRAVTARAVSETLAGGGGAGVAAAIAKGGAVLTLAGAVVGAGGIILTHTSSQHPHPEARSAGPSARPPHQISPAVDGLAARFAPGVAPDGSSSENHVGQAASRTTGDRGRDSGSVGEDHGGSGGDSTGHDGGRSQGGSDGGPSSGSDGGSGGGSDNGATISNSGDGSSGRLGGGSSGGSDGGSTGSGTLTSPTSGSDGGTSGGGASSSDRVSAVGITSGGRTGSDGGSGGTGGSSGSGETTTTSSH